MIRVTLATKELFRTFRPLTYARITPQCSNVSVPSLRHRHSLRYDTESKAACQYGEKHGNDGAWARELSDGTQEEKNKRGVAGSTRIRTSKVRMLKTSRTDRDGLINTELVSKHEINERAVGDNQPKDSADWLRFEELSTSGHGRTKLKRRRRRERQLAYGRASETLTFSDLGVHRELCDGLMSIGIQRPFDIQTRAIPLIREGKDCILSAPTGTGKTLSYILPLVQRVYEFHDAIKASRNNATSVDNPLSHIRPWVILAVRSDLCAQVSHIFNID